MTLLAELALWAMHAVAAIPMLVLWWWWFQPPGLGFTQRFEQQLKDLQAQKTSWQEKAHTHDQLVDEVVVTLRKPMQTLLQLCARVRQQHDVTPELQTHLARVSDALMLMQAIMSDLLDPLQDQALNDTPQLRVTWAACDVRAVVRQAFEWFAPRCQRLGLNYRCDIAPSVPEQLTTDAHRLKQVRINLLGNAVKFTHEGRISLFVSADDHYVTFELEDTGVGIAMHQQSVIFERYAQAPASAQARFGGHGLGLAISRQLITQLGGELGVASVLGQGSRFWFTLPRRPRMKEAFSAG